MHRISFVVFIVFLLVSCSTSKNVRKEAPKTTSKEVSANPNPKILEKALSKEEKIINTFIENPTFQNHLFGIVLHDVEKNKSILNFNGQKLFTPASNIKLFTLYTALKLLDQKESLIKFKETDQALFFKGTGHPAFLHPYLPKASQAFDFLNASKKSIYYCSDHFDDQVFNPGWAIDDIPFYYQVEKSSLPMFGNTSWLSRAKGQKEFKIVPPKLKNNIKYTSQRLKYPLRSTTDNTILVSNELSSEKDWSMDIPIKTSNELITLFLSDTLNRKVSYGCTDQMSQTISDYPTGELYKRMMQKSDNHIAEQLLLMCSDKMYDTLNTARIIRYALDSLMEEIPNKPRWVDGSGLSRYNLATPSSMVWVLERIQRRLGQELIETYFEKIYLDETKSVAVFAKTGSLSNNFCLSGYLTGASGKKYLFSIMHNHFMGTRKKIYTEVKKQLLMLHDEL